MQSVLRSLCASLAATLLCAVSSTSALADDWVVAKSSGQVWVAGAKAQPVSLGRDLVLGPGTSIQTGPNGRVLLTRGQETVLVAPNSVISLPTAPPKSGFTTILQQAGSIAVQAEKKDHTHFEVETPYLAALVKGTQFTVTVLDGAAKVQVTSGRVEVADLKSGQTALVMPGQWATTHNTGLTVSGAGNIGPTWQGTPRESGLQPVPVPKQGLVTPPVGAEHVQDTRNSVRIVQPIGSLQLDVGAATDRLARSDTTPTKSSVGTIWSTVSGPAAGPGNSVVSSTPTATAPGNGVGNAPGLVSNVTGLVGNVAANGNVLGLVGNGNAGANGNAWGLNGGNGIGLAKGLGNGNGKKK